MRLHALYERAALENRTTISNPWPVAKNESLTDNGWNTGDPQASWRRWVEPVVNGTAADPALGTPIRLPGAQATTLSILGRSRGAALANGCLAACVDDWKAEAAASGFADRLVYYTCDEPYQNPDWWTECSQVHDQISGPSGLPELVTGAIDTAQTEGGGAQTWIDTLVPLVRQLAGKPGTGRWEGDQSGDYTSWLAGDDGDGNPRNLWLYTSCESGGCNGRYSADPTGWNGPYWNGWAGYAIDAPASQARAAGWLAFEYGARGELYYNATTRLDDAWNECTTVSNGDIGNCLYNFGLNGDGTLFYPGLACPPANGPGCIGGTSDIPVESIRLKRMRDGREDYEYLHVLGTSGNPDDAAFAQTTALGLFGPTLDEATFSTTVSAADLEAARAAVAARIAGDVTPPSDVYAPDVWLRPHRATRVAWTGDDVRNRTGAGQTITLKVRAGRIGAVDLRVSNDGNTTDSYSLVGTGRGGGFATTYYAGRRDITRGVVTGTASTKDLAAAAAKTYRLVVTPKRSLASGTTRTYYFHAVSFRSTDDPPTRDTVKVHVRVR
jgi:hypothetical protein